MADSQVDGMVAAALIAALTMLVSVVASVIFCQPFAGVMIRLRAQYAPIGISLDGKPDHTVPPLNGVFATLKRTMRLEGWQGIYKGAVAALITGLLTILPFTGLLMWAILTGVLDGSGSGPLAFWKMRPEDARSYNTMVRHSGWSTTPDLDMQLGVAITIFTVLAIPCTVAINRAIVTPYGLPYSIRKSLPALFSRHERNNPWSLFCTPGLAVSLLLSLLGTLLLNAAAPLVVPGLVRDYPWHTAAYVLFYAFNAAWIVPLSVVMCKTSVQLNLGRSADGYTLAGSSADGVAELTADGSVPLVEDLPRASSSDEDVVQLRPALPRYTSLCHALVTIKAEEGLAALYRGWIWTALSLALTGFAQATKAQSHTSSL